MNLYQIELPKIQIPYRSPLQYLKPLKSLSVLILILHKHIIIIDNELNDIKKQFVLTNFISVE